MSCLFYLSCQIYCPFNIFWICSYVTSSFLILIICVFSFFFLICLARDLADVSVVSKKQLLVSFPLFSFLVDWLPHLTVLFPIFLLTLCWICSVSSSVLEAEIIDLRLFFLTQDFRVMYFLLTAGNSLKGVCWDNCRVQFVFLIS